MTDKMEIMFLVHSQRVDSLEIALQAEAARTRTATADLENRAIVESKTREKDAERQSASGTSRRG